MARTGESFQQARQRVLALHAAQTDAHADARVDLLAVRYFGRPLALATFEIAGRLAVLALSGPAGPGPFPLNPLLALGVPRAVH